MRLALAAVPEWYRGFSNAVQVYPPDGLVRFMLERAAPLITAPAEAERDRARAAAASDRRRAKRADEKLAAVAEHCRNPANWQLRGTKYGSALTGKDLVRAVDILAITGSEERPARLSDAECDRPHEMVTEHTDAIAAIGRALESAAQPGGADCGTIAAAWEALRVIEGSEEESRG